jgi:hypothetical protein
LEIPNKYEYLANNAAKWESHKPKAATIHEAHKKALKAVQMHSKGKQHAIEEDPMVVENGSRDGAGAFIHGSSKDGMDVHGIEHMEGIND